MPKASKFYVVWSGQRPGVYESWEECQKQIKNYPNAKFKGFPTRIAAEKAYEGNYESFKSKGSKGKALFALSDDQPKPVYPSIAVDAAWNTATGDMEYQGVDAKSKRLIFHQGPYRDGTNNIGEFLAIVHALALLKREKSSLPIYTDSMTAITWVRNRRANTKLIKSSDNEILFELIDRAEKWLKENIWKNPILKWETPIWGEIPADFGRK
jgi:ribonuclease HI